MSARGEQRPRDVALELEGFVERQCGCPRAIAQPLVGGGRPGEKMHVAAERPGDVCG